MNIEAFLQYCLTKKGVTEETPFGPDTLVMKVMGKMFAVTGLDEVDFRVNLKCDPDRAQQLRADYEQIIPGWHMNKVHWNTVYFEQGLSDELLMELIDHSYELVVKGLKKSDRLALENL